MNNPWCLYCYEQGEGRIGAVIVPMSDDDDYVSPDFDLPSESEPDVGPPHKRSKGSASFTWAQPQSLVDEEALALRFLRNQSSADDSIDRLFRICYTGYIKAVQYIPVGNMTG